MGNLCSFNEDIVQPKPKSKQKVMRKPLKKIETGSIILKVSKINLDSKMLNKVLLQNKANSSAVQIIL